MVVLFHKIVKNVIHSNYQFQLNHQVSNMNTRRCNAIRPRRIKTTKYGRNSVDFQGISWYNSLPNEARDLDLPQFICYVKDYFHYF